MDKLTRFVQPLSKGANFDKKNQDINNGKLWTKGSNYRELAFGSWSVKPEATRKNTPNRSRNFDKRPRPRGRPDDVARDEESGLDEPQVELGSVFQPGSKKQSLNHLLNFTFAPRDGEGQYGVAGLRGRSGNHTLYSKKHKYNKEHFLQANCQFIVNTSGDYKQYLTDPDALVDWIYIEQINVQVNEPPSCPICLHPPAAAKITQCGHIYCWSCILHYLSLSKEGHQNCPICFGTVCKEDLKSVIVIPHHTFNIGERITFKLMKRNLTSLTPCPAEDDASENPQIQFFDRDSVKIHSKLLLAGNSDILSIINREDTELQFQYQWEEESEKPFVKEAMVYLKERESMVLESMVKAVDLSESSSRDCASGYSKRTNGSKVVDQRDTKYIYFYQASDGQHIYIDSFNVRMLKHTYGSLEFAPNVITAKILAKEEDSMTEEYRVCYKYLAHLPVSCPFDTVEVELTKPVISAETLDFFKDELEERKKHRSKKAKDEKRREKRITEEENIKLYKKYPTILIPLESTQQFPAVGFEVPLEPNLEGSSLASSINQERETPSFAKMAAASRAAPDPWPNLRSSSSYSPVVTTTKELKGLNILSARRRYDTTKSNVDEQESSDHELVPETRATFGDAIAQALQKATCHDQLNGDPGSSDEKSRKKKKKKQRILLSTSLRYSPN